MVKMLTALIGLIGALWLAFAGAFGMSYYDRHFQGFAFGPQLPFNIPCCRITIPAGGMVGDAKAIATLKQAFVTEQAAFNTEKAALDEQGRAVRALKTSADAWQARSVKAVQQASSGQAWRLTLADQLRHLTLPADATSDAACTAAEAMLRGAAR